MDEQHNKDVSTIKIQELEQQLKKCEIELEEANNQFQSFSQKVSHDLHAPLRAIQTYMSMISTDYVGKTLDDDALRMISRVMSNTEEMKLMLDGLLELNRVSKKELTIQRVDVNGCVKNICHEVQGTYPNRKLIFQVAVLSDISADEELLKKVWKHLISNAAKFTGKKEEGIVQISSEEKNGEVIYSIKDNGDGFDMMFYDKLFGVFQRLHHKSDFEGVGIGLAIVKKILNSLNGKVWAEARVNEGAVFYFSLPASL
jgi:light-regulated signal transduction histidine kinase (bacteriophytochrome)